MRKIRVLDNVYDLITINMEDRFKDNVAFRFYDTANDAVTTILYKDYVQDIRKAVNYFQSTIPEIKGKKICLLTKNSYEYAVNTFGVVAAGAVLVLLNQRKSWDELSYELGLVEPDAILTDGDDYGFNDQLKAAYGDILRPMDGFRSYEPALLTFSAQPAWAQENRQMNAPRWNMGSTVYWLTTSSGSCLYSIMRSPICTWARITLKKLRSLSITPLLRPVVPEVNIRIIRSSWPMQRGISATGS